MIRLNRAAYFVPALALLALFGTRASASLPATVHGHAIDAVATDPEPPECPFCGGVASVHIQRMDDLERATLALYTTLLR